MTEFSSKVINRVMEALAANREVTDRQLRTMAETVERAVTGMQQSAQNMQQSAQNIQQSAQNMERSAERIEYQVGLMSEHLTAIDIKIERLGDKIDGLADRISELTSAVNGHLEVAKQQALNIGELTKLVAAQANMLATVINRTG